MIIGWSTWEPGLASAEPTSAGGAAWTRHLFDAFRADGNQIMMLQGDAPNTLKPTNKVDLLAIDVAVFCWRWPMPEYPERQLAFERQIKYIEFLGEANIPMIVHDQDHKLTHEDRAFLKKYDVLIAAPQFVRGGDHSVNWSLFFPNPFPRAPLKMWGTEAVDFVYVGNNYERFDQVVQYVQPISEYYNTVFYGNWLEPGPNRAAPETVRKLLPSVDFRGRLPQDEVLDVLSRANTTMHFAKQSYLQQGFVTLRWAEAAAANIIAFVPDGMYLPPEYRYHYNRLGLIPRNGTELMEAVEWIRHEQLWPEILELQWRFVQDIMTVDRWFDILNIAFYKGLQQ